MKKQLICIILCIYSLTASGQITKGNWMVGGNINFASTTYKSTNFSENTAYDFQINPNIGYFFTNKFAMGLKVGIRLLGAKGTGTTYSTYNNFNFGPFLRYYFLPTDNIINVLMEGAYQYGMEGNKNQNTAKNTLAFNTGVVVFFNSVVGVEFLVGYSTYKFSDISGNNVTIQLGLGLQVHLQK
ncbi:MAG: porin family protein [Chitinophagales bacterium]|nr:porin family protein [Chitinophagales bacterium]